MTGHVVGTTDEIGPGQRKIVEIDGRSIGVFNVDGRYYALRNTCPHAGARLCEGTLSGLVTSGAPGEYTLRAGRRDPAVPVARLGVRRHHRALVVRPGPHPGAGLRGQHRSAVETGYRPGPYVAETYAVEVQQAYVVVHV